MSPERQLAHNTQRLEGDVRPLSDRVVIRKHAPLSASAGGIILDAAGKDATRQDIGTVVAIGPGKPRKDGGRAPMWVSVGDEVFFSPNGHVKIHKDGEDFVMIGINSIIGVIE